MKNLEAVIRTAREIHDNINLVDSNDDKLAPYFFLVGKFAGYTEQKLKEKYDNPDFQLVAVVSPITTTLVYGMSAIFPEEATAYITCSSLRNYCWRRYVYTKEICHHYTGYYQSSFEGEPLIQLARASRDSNYSRDTELDDEQFCLFLAIELMIPWKFRGEISDVYRQQNSTYQVALSTRVPLSIVDFFFNNDYSGVSAEINRSVS